MVKAANQRHVSSSIDLSPSQIQLLLVFFFFFRCKMVGTILFLICDIFVMQKEQVSSNSDVCWIWLLFTIRFHMKWHQKKSTATTKKHEWQNMSPDYPFNVPFIRCNEFFVQSSHGTPVNLALIFIIWHFICITFQNIFGNICRTTHHTIRL